MKITIDGTIRVEHPSMDLSRGIKKALSIPNPDYFRLIKRNPKLKYALTERIPYYRYDRKDDVLTFSRGSLGRLRAYLERTGERHEIIDRRTRVSARVRGNGILRLRDYQVGVPEELALHDSGIARCDTGYGKTVVAIRLAELLGQRTLFIVPKLDLLTQFVKDIEKFYDIKASVIQGDQFEIGDMTVATAQSLRNRIKEGKVSRDSFGCVIADEAHLFVPAKQRAVIEWFSAYYRFGFTATARRSDGQGEAIGFLFGPQLIDKKLPRKTPVVQQVPYYGAFYGLEYHEIIEEQTRDPERNRLIAEHVARQCEAGRKTLVLTKRVEHYESLSSDLIERGIDKVYALSSTEKGSVRKDVLERLRSKPDSFNVILGTFSLLSTGTDIPALDTLVLAGDLKSDVLAEQSVGRVLRLFEGKPDPVVIDITDRGNGILKNQARLRRKFYIEQGWEVIDYTK